MKSIRCLTQSEWSPCTGPTYMVTMVGWHCILFTMIWELSTCIIFTPCRIRLAKNPTLSKSMKPYDHPVHYKHFLCRRRTRTPPSSVTWRGTRGDTCMTSAIDHATFSTSACFVQGDPSDRIAGLGWLWFWLFHLQPGSAWAHGHLAKVSE